jgi:hypothetical protein
MRLAFGLNDGGKVVRFSVGTKDFSVVQTCCGTHPAPIGWVLSLFPGRLNEGGVKVTIHLHLPRLRVIGALSPHTPHKDKCALDSTERHFLNNTQLWNSEQEYLEENNMET